MAISLQQEDAALECGLTAGVKVTNVLMNLLLHCVCERHDVPHESLACHIQCNLTFSWIS